jgi:hypothetical protein
MNDISVWCYETDLGHAARYRRFVLHVVELLGPHSVIRISTGERRSQ